MKITIEALVKANIDKVWDCWTLPEHIVSWNFASADWHCPKAENDLQIGGRYMARMEARDGSFGFDFEAIYDKVVKHNTISYNMADGRNATTQFEELGDTVKVTTVFDAENTNPVDMQQQGWQAILNNFKTYVESF